MKAMVLVPAAIAAVLALNFSTMSPASSQQACQKEYIACMDTCAGRSSKTMQDSCFSGCEGKNNFCAERVYGKRPMGAAPSNVAEGQAKDALAKKQNGASPEAAQAEAKEQVAEERAPQQEPQAPQPKAPQQKAPARR